MVVVSHCNWTEEQHFTLITTEIDINELRLAQHALPVEVESNNGPHSDPSLPPTIKWDG